MARSFDLILSEYGGYTDESILDLTLDRIRQMVKVIAERRTREVRAQQRWDLAVQEAAAKIVASSVAGTAQTKKAAKAIQAGLKSIDMVRDFDRQNDVEPDAKPKEKIPLASRVMSAFGVSRSGEAGRRA